MNKTDLLHHLINPEMLFLHDSIGLGTPGGSVGHLDAMQFTQLLDLDIDEFLASI